MPWGTARYIYIYIYILCRDCWCFPSAPVSQSVHVCIDYHIPLQEGFCRQKHGHRFFETLCGQSQPQSQKPAAACHWEVPSTLNRSRVHNESKRVPKSVKIGPSGLEGRRDLF